MERYAIGLDLGGSKLAYGLVDQTGKVIFYDKEPLRNHLPWSVTRQMGKAAMRIVDAFPDKKILGIGCGLPGLIYEKQKIVHQSPHFPDWNDLEIGELLANQFDLPFLIANDAHMFAHAELTLGLGKEHADFILLTLGTGIGGAYVFDSKIHRGTRGYAAEFGHMVFDRDGPLCLCGAKGCFELFASSSAFPFLAQNIQGDEEFLRLCQEKNGAGLLRLAETNHQHACMLFQNFGRNLGRGVNSLVNIFGLEHVVFAGALTQAWKFFSPSLQESIGDFSYKRHAKNIHLTPSSFGEQGGVLGAGLSVFSSIAV